MVPSSFVMLGIVLSRSNHLRARRNQLQQSQHNYLRKTAQQFWKNSTESIGVFEGQEDSEGDEVYFLFPEDLVDSVSLLVRDLIASFENLVKNHGHNHLSGTRIADYILTAYDSWVLARSSRGIRDTRKVCGDWDTLAVEVSTRCRLIDDGEAIWEKIRLFTNRP
ncbi:unnamed protein product [Penicillium glandicola]